MNANNAENVSRFLTFLARTKLRGISQLFYNSEKREIHSTQHHDPSHFFFLVTRTLAFSLRMPAVYADYETIPLPLYRQYR